LQTKPEMKLRAVGCPKFSIMRTWRKRLHRLCGFEIELLGQTRAAYGPSRTLCGPLLGVSCQRELLVSSAL